MLPQSRLDPLLEERIVIWGHRQPAGRAAPLGDLAGQHQRVELDDLAWLDVWARLDQFRPGRHDRDARAAADLHVGAPARGGRAEVDRAEHLALGQDKLSRDDVLAHRPDVLPGRDWCHDLDLLAEAL